MTIIGSIPTCGIFWNASKQITYFRSLSRTGKRSYACGKKKRSQSKSRELIECTFIDVSIWHRWHVTNFVIRPGLFRALRKTFLMPWLGAMALQTIYSKLLINIHIFGTRFANYTMVFRYNGVHQSCHFAIRHRIRVKPTNSGLLRLRVPDLHRFGYVARFIYVLLFEHGWQYCRSQSKFS